MGRMYTLPLGGITVGLISAANPAVPVSKNQPSSKPGVYLNFMPQLTPEAEGSQRINMRRPGHSLTPVRKANALPVGNVFAQRRLPPSKGRGGAPGGPASGYLHLLVGAWADDNPPSC